MSSFASRGLEPAKPDPPKPSLESDYMRREREELERTMPLFAGTVRQ